MEKPIYIKFVNKKIKTKEAYVEKPRYLWIDVIPIDALPSNDRTLNKIFRQARVYRHVFTRSWVNAEYGKNSLKKWIEKRLLPVIRKTGIPDWGARHLFELCMRCPFGSTDYVGCLSWGLYGAGERYPLSGFEHLTQVEFEGHMFPSISCWDSYLTGIYGDYMTLPPEGQRHTHDMKAWRVSDVNEEKGI